MLVYLYNFSGSHTRVHQILFLIIQTSYVNAHRQRKPRCIRNINNHECTIPGKKKKKHSNNGYKQRENKNTQTEMSRKVCLKRLASFMEATVAGR